MILLRRRNKSNILSDYINSIQNDIDDRLDDRILRLDRRHLTRNSSVHRNQDVAMSSLHPNLRRKIEQASVVIYKEDWSTNAYQNVTVIKFRYDTKELTRYLNIIKTIPVLDKVKIYNSNGDIIEETIFYKDYWNTTRY